MQTSVVTLAETIAQSLSGEDHNTAIDALDMARILLRRGRANLVSPQQSEDREESQQSLSAA